MTTNAAAVSIRVMIMQGWWICTVRS